MFDFVPGGGTPTVRSDTTTAQCNSCHAPLRAHGNRREVRLCTLCHTEAAVDEQGESIDFRHMIHKIHAGVDLHLVNAGPPGTTYEIDGTVFAEKQADGSVTGVAFPRDLEECLTCHAEGPTAEFYRTKASTGACATCHDDVNPSLQTTAAGPPGTNHAPGAYADGQCSACHAAEQSQEFDISVPGAHVVPARSAQLQGLNVTISAVSSHAAGQQPTITFTVTDDAGTPLRDLSGLSSLAFNYAGPTTDYTTQLNGNPLGSSPSGTLVGPDAQGAFQFTPNAALPADATGTWALGAEARRNVQLTSTVSATEAAVNPVVTFTVDDSAPLVRRTVVDDQLCGSCHGEFSKDFSIHGGSRNQVEYCVLCHNPTESDADRRNRDPAQVAAGALTATIDFKVLIHKIHRGEDLEQKPYIVYGFGSGSPGYTVHDFSEVRFPGDLRICESCHVEGSELIPPYPGTALPTLRTQLDPATGDPVPADPPQTEPITSVCTACHDSDAAIAHAETQTAPDGAEACRGLPRRGARRSGVGRARRQELVDAPLSKGRRAGGDGEMAVGCCIATLLCLLALLLAPRAGIRRRPARRHRASSVRCATVTDTSRAAPRCRSSCTATGVSPVCRTARPSIPTSVSRTTSPTSTTARPTSSRA